MAKIVYTSNVMKTVAGVMGGNGFEIEGKTYLKLSGFDFSVMPSPRIMGIELESNTLHFFSMATPCVERDVVIHLQR